MAYITLTIFLLLLVLMLGTVLKIYKTFRYIHYSCVDAYDICHFCKQHNMPFSKSDSYSSKIFNMINTDIWGPIFLFSIHGLKYFISSVDNHNRHT